ncbi:pyruvate ferredoxin oxidoreductase [Sulfurisphaera ohwakuensis]|uniref:2-oxoacid oxidoreductase (ferredoxin) n=1 Tax=Sulfurisphaera ohwakuensis TaxID=69656 RepID=A0A650CI18_SULOH|nr:pyruvate ferredoxin oxidoreductase [Sulfurisphaera ohwakuensis]MBB5253825.1 pyruvate ferredoxin oxidoreductase alpha subunit [Sulfurisphaera ohwakuensis]QGR17501.1 pyruvate ferredoxin oxidoreductase [Sulfurisphaera ohwakuensis]
MISKVISGNEAVALGVKLSRVKVIAIYPITPQTYIIEELAAMRDKGELDAEVIRVESEHSAMAAVYGAASAGVRVYTATASQGLLYMHEMIWWVAGSRIPIVMTVGTRAVGAPWNIWNEHTDFMSERDSGWIMAFASTPQEALDLTIQAFKISEDERVFLPMMVGMDGFILSHTKTRVYIPSQEEVDSFLPPRKQPYVLDPEDPVDIGNMFQPIDYMKFRHSMHLAMLNSKEVIKEIGKEYEKKVVPVGSYSSLNESYKLDDAEYALVSMGAWSLDAMQVVDELRNMGVKIGLYRIRYVRPWDEEDIKRKLGDKDGILVLDRSVSFGRGGHLYLELKATLPDVNIKGVVTGLGGVAINKDAISSLTKKFIEGKTDGEWFYPSEVEKVELRNPRYIK